MPLLRLELELMLLADEALGFVALVIGIDPEGLDPGLPLEVVAIEPLVLGFDGEALPELLMDEAPVLVALVVGIDPEALDPVFPLVVGMEEALPVLVLELLMDEAPVLLGLDIGMDPEALDPDLEVLGTEPVVVVEEEEVLPMLLPLILFMDEAVLCVALDIGVDAGALDPDLVVEELGTEPVVVGFEGVALPMDEPPVRVAVEVGI